MPIKETPLLKSVERLGPLPGFLFASPFLAGVVAVVMVPFFFGVFFLFPSMSYGIGAEALVVFDVFHTGAVVGFVFAVVLTIGLAITTLFQKDEDERQYRFQFLQGAVAALLVMLISDILFLETVRAWVAPFKDTMNGYKR
ncbi:hypothetical protein [Hyphococcus sp.]|uniref:hypothetical protein n=1 Tax=Hyphococcus sp. TaxID=2038636 RepID=UPI002088AA4A|nr:MAG: hypothetical protein DHS20C04_25260 [Marinicaulis sp.]